ncbi:hypothetical protein KKB64_02005 [Patescibacteria group bacterium]|nr:hypothetical protein [Patescibacteria group bacterium]MBU1472544.1 hypothetical protein [Patescibacteria group bacterium]MBU2460083.1 hypothetical protein [Patescibacteria group bacterium]MBU2544652.1 hypothetical protein [Patescibacteria group bacterium]
MSPDDIREQLELQIVEFIKVKLADGTLTEERAQEMSKAVLGILKPGMNFEELYRAIPKLDDRFQELSPIILPLLKEYEERVVGEVQKNVSELIKIGQYDAAVKLGEQTVKQEIPLQWEGSGKQKRQVPAPKSVA